MWDEPGQERPTQFNDDDEVLDFRGEPVEPERPVVGMPELGYEPEEDED